MTAAMAPQDFVTKWRHVTTNERASAQSHFNDLCRVLGLPTPHDDDAAGERYAFERRATKTGGPTKGKQGWADVWKRGAFAWEYKKAGEDLDRAYQQLLQYRESLENPPLLVVSDLHTIHAHTNFPNTVKQVHSWTLDDLLNPQRLDELRRVWNDPFAFRAPQTTEQVTDAAAREFARLADLLRAQGAAPPAAAHFLIRLLFCLFAEDVGLLPSGLLSQLIARTRTRPLAFTQQLRLLFGAMATGGWFGTEEIAHFNGGLFDDDAVIELDRDGLEILAEIYALDWSSIEPSILGTLFERSLDPGKRAQLGAHYTSKQDILLIVEPVLMAPLRRRWLALQDQAQALAARRDAASGAQRTRLDNELRTLLLGFQHEVASIRVLDPACGSGNFLYVALKQLLDLEKEVIVFMGEVGLTRPFPSVSPEQLRGIELNEYAHELAQTTVWIGYIQWLRDNGFGQPSEPILKRLDTIRQMDAILAYDEQGSPYEPAWPEADVIIGNPPFLGDKKMRAELGHIYVEHLRALFEGRIPGGADLVCYWFEKARERIESGVVKRAGLLATQGIRGGANRKVLERIKASGGIFWAQSDRNWILDGATVHVSMVGFDDHAELSRILDGQIVSAINADLTSAVDLTKAQPLRENHGIAFIGTQKGGPFDISSTHAQQILQATGNPNGRPNSDVVRPWINGSDITGRPRGMWIIDFGSFMPLEEAAEYEMPFEYVRRYVYPVRAGLRRDNHRKYWWIHAESRPGMRAALHGLTRYIATPRVSKHRLFAWQRPEIVPDSAAVAIAHDDDYFFGVVHCKLHELWARGTGTQLREAESGFRYTPTSTFETFPFPWAPGMEPAGDPGVAAIALAAHDLVEKRDRWLNPGGAGEAELKKHTLTNLYNERPAWLQIAHKKLDDAVLDAYDWPHDLSDDDILARLLALNLERAAQQGAVAGGADDEE